MIKLHGFGGPSGFWDYNLESFTLMAGLDAVTTRIQLFATCAVLTIPPPIAARMAVTIDSISHGRFGVNIISGWQRREYTQMGIWPGAEHYRRRYEYCAEYHERAVGERAFRLQGRLLPNGRLPLPAAADCESADHLRRAERQRHAVRGAVRRYNICGSGGVNQPTRVAASVARLVAATRETGRACGALVLQMVITDETDAAAMAKWEHYKVGIDLEAVAWRDAPAEDDPNEDPYSQAHKRRTLGIDKSPTNQGCWSGHMHRLPACWTNWPRCPACRVSC
jgi:pyrimidine oxygenase